MKLPVLYISPLILYTMFISRVMLIFMKKKHTEDDMEVNETVASVSYFEKKKTEEAKIQISFEDVAGLEEIKEDLLDIIDFLNNEDKYRLMDAKVPTDLQEPSRPLYQKR
jgi:cell division protease FtsH